MLTFDALRNANVHRCEHGFGHTLQSWSVAEWGAATAGEVGEACNIAKKMLRFRDRVKGNDPVMKRDDFKPLLARELADVVIYLDLWAASEGIDLGKAVVEIFNAKSREIGTEIKLGEPV